MSYAEVTVVKGDIVRQADCDGIVNSANQYLIAGGGVSRAIYAAAGPQLEPYSRQFAPLLLGEALATPAFNLLYRFIIHVRAPKFHLDEDPPGNLAKALRNAIILADQNGLKRLAIPAIAMGVYGYPPEKAVPILTDNAIELAGTLQTLQEIRFVVANDLLVDLFRTNLAKTITSHESGLS